MPTGNTLGSIAGDTAQAKISVINNNIANVNTTGYQKTSVSFEIILGNAKNGGKSMSIGTQHIDMAKGIIKNTGGELDLAITGDGFFKVQTGEGVGYTRAGSFTINQEGNLTTQGGYVLLGSGDQPINMNGGGTVNVTENGLITLTKGNSKEEKGKIDIFNFNDNSKLRKMKGTVITTSESNVKLSDAKIAQGRLEMSNVNSVIQMAEMVSTMRNFQTAMKVIERYNQQAGLLNNQVGTVNG